MITRIKTVQKKQKRQFRALKSVSKLRKIEIKVCDGTNWNCCLEFTRIFIFSFASKVISFYITTNLGWCPSNLQNIIAEVFF
jgi:hypothetical protein